MSFAADADATSITARKKKALDFVNKVKQESAMVKKETEVKETEVQETKVKETEVKETEVKETEVKENEVKKSEVKETEVQKTKDEAAVEERMAAMAEELRAATAAIVELKLRIERQLPPPCRHHAARRCWYGAAGYGCRFSHGTSWGSAAWRSAPPPSPPPSPRASRRLAPPSSTQVKSSPMLERHSVSESSYTPSPRVAAVTAHCGWHKNTLEEATAVIQSIDDTNEEVCEDEHAAAEVCKELIEKVVREEQLHFVKTMVGKADDLEAKYKAKNKPAEDEDGVIRSPPLPRISVDFARVNPFALAKLPKPDRIPLQGCSLDPTTYTRCGKHYSASCAGGKKDCDTAFEKSKFVFGFGTGFVTNLGVIAPPTDPIFGYTYVGGFGDSTQYALYAEAG